MKKGGGVMPKFRIYGADEKTGEDTNIIVNADTPDDAAAIARGRGIFISRCVEIEFVQPPLPAKLTNESTGKIDKRVMWKRAKGFGKGKLKYCPNCKQNIQPKLPHFVRSFFYDIALFFIFVITMIIAFTKGWMWFGIPFIVFVALVWPSVSPNRHACPICGTPGSDLEKVR